MSTDNTGDFKDLLMAFSWKTFEFSNSLCRVGRRTYDEPFTSSSHNHDYAQLLYCREKSFIHTIDGVEYVCNEGSLSIVPPGVFHKFQVFEGTSVFWIDIAFNALSERNIKSFPSTAALIFAHEARKKLHTEIPAFYDLSKNRNLIEEKLSDIEKLSKSEAKKAETLIPFEKIAKLVLPLSASDTIRIEKLFSSRLGPIISTLEYLNAHYGSKISCEDLLRKSLFCSTSFYGHFKNFIGCTYSTYLQMLRVSRAHRAISFNTYSFSYISDMCGFSDLSHMEKCYKRFNGYTPTEERHRSNYKNPEYANLRISHDFFDMPEEK